MSLSNSPCPTTAEHLPASGRFFNSRQAVKEDPIFKLLVQYRNDSNPQKMDLGIGVYRNDSGQSPIFNSVKAAEAVRLERENDKSYIGPAGDFEYRELIETLVYGQPLAAKLNERLAGVQTPGGVAALRIGFELVARINPQATVWLSDPTWQVHWPIVGATGLQTQTYRYYDKPNHRVDFEAMLADLSRAKPGDVILLQGCCHNPTGCNLTLAQWQQLTDLCLAQGLLPMVDLAYHGLGGELDQDAAGLRLMVQQLPELILTYTCSKNFGLYRDRVGLISVLTDNIRQGEIVQKQLVQIATEHYFTPPAHGSDIVKTILSDKTLRENWESELEAVRNRLDNVRTQISEAVAAIGRDWSYLTQQTGMFSLLDLSPAELAVLREQHSIYIVDSGRINVAGINAGNIEVFVNGVASLAV